MGRRPHLFATLRQTLLEFEWLEFMQIPMGASIKATKALHLAWTLTAKRAWTMAKHSAPPQCYANALRPGDEFAEARQARAAMMKTHHENVLSLEIARHNIADANEVWEACLYLHMQPIRLVWAYFRRDTYSALSPLGNTSCWDSLQLWLIIRSWRIFMLLFAWQRKAIPMTNYHHKRCKTSLITVT